MPNIRKKKYVTRAMLLDSNKRKDATIKDQSETMNLYLDKNMSLLEEVNKLKQKLSNINGENKDEAISIADHYIRFNEFKSDSADVNAMKMIIKALSK